MNLQLSAHRVSLEMKYILAFIPLHHFRMNGMYLNRRWKNMVTPRHVLSVLTGSFSPGLRELGGICWNLLRQRIVALDLTMLWICQGCCFQDCQRSVFPSFWTYSTTDAGRREYFELFSERSHSVPSDTGGFGSQSELLRSIILKSYNCLFLWSDPPAGLKWSYFCKLFES